MSKCRPQNACIARTRQSLPELEEYPADAPADRGPRDPRVRAQIDEDFSYARRSDAGSRGPSYPSSPPTLLSSYSEKYKYKYIYIYTYNYKYK